MFVQRLLRLHVLGCLALILSLTAPAALAQPASTGDMNRAGRFDNGKMWTFDYPPRAYLSEAYNFEPDDAWFTRARLGALRIPGCTASFVSAHGLVMTNHHCGRDATAAVSQPGENLLDEGFYATSLDKERKADNMYADQLIAIEDVTDEVYATLEDAQTDAERAQARQDIIEQIQTRIGTATGGDAAGMHVEVISLYNGGRYSAYTFKRYSDVRLVMVPEVEIGYYGGDADNFTYPRYVLDMTFFRIYQNGQPYETPNYFKWSESGVEEGSLVFAIGNPGSTFRLETVAQLEYRRDVREPAVLHLYQSRADALQAAFDEMPENEDKSELQNQIFGFRNGQKLYEGRVRALNNAMIMARRADTERQLGEAISTDASLQAESGTLIYEMAAVQGQKTELGPEFGAFLTITNPAFSSATLRRAILAYRYLTQQQSGATDEALADLREQLLAVTDQPDGIDSRLLKVQLTDIQRYMGENHDIVQNALDGQNPLAVAEAILSGSALTDAASTAEALENRSLSMDDPAVALAAAFVPRLLDYQSATAGLTARETELAGDLGRARYAVYGTDLPPDATFSLRLADGVVQGYDYNGTVTPPYVTFYGMYDRYYGFMGDPNSEWELPARWKNPPENFDLETPINFVSTADITGGNSGSPVINSKLEIVGLIFDGNVESLSGDYIYLPETNRAVSVDARGMIEALDDIYGADRLVLELRGTQFVPSEEEADALSSSE